MKDDLHICTSENPNEILLQFEPNGVKEDSFELSLRRKTKWVPSNFFLNSQADDEYKSRCPVDNAYARSDTRCSGGYVNGAFEMYPPFVYSGCQCQVVLDELISELKSDQEMIDQAYGMGIDPMALDKELP